uniref:Translin-associated protein X n=1 Tax=Macrostomum lignano TaxID=282301 RepID=A0A1I8JM51_9PLAT
TFKERLDVKQDRRERIVKLSRDITMESKRLIFTLHRVAGASDEERLAVLTEVSQRLDKLIASKLLPISSELTGQDPWEYRRAYSPGLQELIEAMTFLEFLSTGRLLSLSGGVRDRLPSGLLVSQFDYLLGVCDLSGESCLAAAAKQCQTARSGLVPKDFAGKLETMRQSVEKVETVCYQQCLRCIEESNITTASCNPLI